MLRPALLALLFAAPLAAQPAGPDAPPPPTDQEVTAVFTDEAPRIDGRLDELLWDRIVPIRSFTQVWPDDGSEPTETTEVRVAYDRDYLYVAFRNLDRNPELIRAKNLERGGRNDRDDHVYIGLDTFRDGRNAYLFEMNALGTQDDATITDEGLTIDSFSWDAVFRSETHIGPDGWTLEAAIPFRQLRFPEGDDLSFGFMVSRMINRKNERVIWPDIGLERGSNFLSLAAVSRYGVVTGLKDINRGLNLEVKPYGITGAQQSRPDLGLPTEDASLTADAGVDIKYGLSSNLTLDLTVNTDFAQVEADNVQINLSRFSLFFPEKREFFLERSGLFEHGNPRFTQTFFSRRIGLAEDILAGARVTGQVGPLSVGAMSLETGSGLDNLFGSQSTTNTVARVRADVLPKTTVGAIVTDLRTAGRSNQALGVDGLVRFGRGGEVSGWATQVWDTDPDLTSSAGHVFGRVQNQTAEVSGSLTSVGAGYAPALGFVRRRDLRRAAASATYRPFVAVPALPFVRRVSVSAEGDVITGQDGELQTTGAAAAVRVDFPQRDYLALSVERSFERLEEPFAIRTDEVVAPGDYTFVQLGLTGETDSSRPVFGRASASTGGFFDGTRTDLSATAGWRQSRHLVLEPSVSHSVVDVGNGDFAVTVGSLSALTAFSRTLFGRTLLQYDNVSRQLQANVRLDWIHRPGSDLFVVFNTAYGRIDEGADPLDPRRTVVLRDRLAVVKLTYLVLI
ncbi:DUF5916 domain-containing protein [Rubrivirga sp. IMCC43871]|uniref:carbohydrate binding family 9 domain-containing protein n=1 Tax=Rubrivirga sp. IMCC43871 TaxID=3391575 RepID=UPI00398FE94B